MEIDLTARQKEALRSVFAQFADRFDRVAVFGSRATGKARRGSDVDLVVHGADDRTMTELWLALEESELSILFDLKDYEKLSDQRFRREVDRDAITLFDARQLQASPTQVAA